MDDLPPYLDFTNSTFAHRTIKDRWPIILAQTVDSLYRHRLHYHNVDGVDLELLKALTGHIGQLRYELGTNKPITLLSAVVADIPEDLNQWNDRLQKMGVRLGRTDDLKDEGAHPKWFGLPWLFAECYLYRRIMDAVVLNGLGHFDPFDMKKRTGLVNSDSLINQLLLFLSNLQTRVGTSDTETLFNTFVQTALWANEFDLSLHTTENRSVSSDGGILDHINQLSERLVVNDTTLLWQFWYSRLRDRRSTVAVQSQSSKCSTILILDNSGPELVADLCLAEFLLQYNLSDRVIFYPKCIPWFVSDVTQQDIDWLLKFGLTSESFSGAFGKLADFWACRWRKRFETGEFSVRVSNFWTLPCAFDELRSMDSSLHDELTHDDVHAIIFKGDLNYRKLVADRSWTPDSPEHKVAAFRPMQLGRSIPCQCGSSSDPPPYLSDPVDCRCSHGEHTSVPLVVSLRVAKADLAVGLAPETLRRVVDIAKDWWTTGRYGLIQIVSPVYLG